MARDVLKLRDPEKVALKNRFSKMVRFIGEHSIPVEFLREHYGVGNAVLGLLEGDGQEHISLLEAVSLGIFNRAMAGDIRAAEFIRDTIGEKPASQVNVSISGEETTLSQLTMEQLQRLLEIKGDNVVEVESEEIFGDDE